MTPRTRKSSQIGKPACKDERERKEGEKRGREGKGREGEGREGEGREGEGREGEGREGKEREGKEREGEGREREGRKEKRRRGGAINQLEIITSVTVESVSPHPCEIVFGLADSTDISCK